jgi:hypothetical protein
MSRRMDHLANPQTRVGRCSLAIVCLALAGCGGDVLERYGVRGTVTFQGKTVEFGAIFFEPTESAGKIAPTVYLPIRDGKFDATNKGPSAGKYRVVVGGMDKSKRRVDDDGITHTPQLFKDYVFEVEIPPPDNTLDIEVPASQAIKRR